MMDSLWIEPSEGLVLCKDPRMLWVPLVEGQVCGVLAHGWVFGDEGVDFYVEVSDSAQPGRLKTVSLPKALWAGEAVFREALRAREDVLMSPTGSKSLVVPDEWEVVAVGGVTAHVVAIGCDLEGPHIAYGMIVKGWPEGARPVIVECLRFPLALMQNDIDFWVTRLW